MHRYRLRALDVYVCDMHTRVFINLHVNIHTYTNIRFTSMEMSSSRALFMYACMHEYVCIRMYVFDTYGQVNTRTQISVRDIPRECHQGFRILGVCVCVCARADSVYSMHFRICMCVCMYVCMYLCSHVCMYTCMCV
jgi:hypothetical protein